MTDRTYPEHCCWACTDCGRTTCCDDDCPGYDAWADGEEQWCGDCNDTRRAEQ